MQQDLDQQCFCLTRVGSDHGVSRSVVQKLEPDNYLHLEQDKALLVGLLADIGLFCLVNEYYLYLENGNYLDQDIALQIFQSSCSSTSKLVLKHWGFDEDFLEVACNEELVEHCQEVSYLDVARIAHHLLMFRKQDDAIERARR